VNLVDRKVLRRHGVMPLRLENGRLVVAMSDPTDLYAIEDLTMLSGYPVTPAVAARGDIERAFERVFAVGQVARLLEEVAAEPPPRRAPRWISVPRPARTRSRSSGS
jgi:type IV pilus assembly protein PilB